MSRVPALAVFAGALVAAGALILAAASGPPYLSTDGVNGWIVLFAAGLFAALLATPFAIEGRLRSEPAGKRRALGSSRAALGRRSRSPSSSPASSRAPAGASAGDSLAGSAGLLTTIEAGLVVVALVFVLLSG